MQVALELLHSFPSGFEAKERLCGSEVGFEFGQFKFEVGHGVMVTMPRTVM